MNPDQCVDCGACEPVCPVESIYHEDEIPRPWKPFIAANAEFCAGLNSPAGGLPAPRDHQMVTSLPTREPKKQDK
ncbi:MAG: 4Fe-4S dicluster domain-containing protein [Pseudonocardiaceae bacterium]